MKILIKCLLIFISINISGQTFLRTNGKAIVNVAGDTVILKAMNLGGWMLIEPYQIQAAGFASAQWEFEEKVEQLIGTAEKDNFLNDWYTNHCRKIDIDSLASWGFNTIRLPMHYNLFTLPTQDEPVTGQNTWLSKGFEMTDSLVSWCKQNNMYVILDLHAAPGGQGGNTGISDYNPAYPSLWESVDNKNKTFSLWRKIAEHYVNEPTIAGYDFLNEVNWNLGTNELRNFYTQLTDSVRSVDQNHILFIEGNWYANDFSGLTPPWDTNMVYSPHKYWSKNFQADIQWVLDIRNTWNVPLWFGESGENSNTWYRNAIRLIEDFDIGWAWWPMKKLESINCPMSITKTTDFQNLLNYWENGTNAPTITSAINTLTQLTEDLKLENCTYQKGVTDAMFRQVYSEETIPYDSIHSIPGRVFATDYDMGVVGEAYYDKDVSDFHVTTGTYTAWNSGWMYRNDGVDISKCNDVYLFHNGYQVGWFEEDEWLQYEIYVDSAGVYDIDVRYSANNTNSSIYFSLNDTALTTLTPLSNTNNWSFWNTHTITDIILDSGLQKIKLHCNSGEINVNSFMFEKTGETSDLDAQFIAAKTLNQYTIEVLFNKPIDFSSIPVSLIINPSTDFTLHIDSTSTINVNSIQFDASQPRIINIGLSWGIDGWSGQTASDTRVDISYSGNQIYAQDGAILSTFSYKPVQNGLSCTSNCIPGIVQAEDYFYSDGIGIEGCSDIGGGENIGYLHIGDYIDYNIEAKFSGSFQVSYRNASNGYNGGIEMQLIDSLGNSTVLNQANFTSTGDWQGWQTTNTSEVFWLDRGIYHIRLLITAQEFNLNWFEFDIVASDDKAQLRKSIKAYPNPTTGLLNISSNYGEKITLLKLYNLYGKLVLETTKNQIDLSDFSNGIYFLKIFSDDDISGLKVIKL